MRFLIASLATIALTISAGSARAAMVAGWDFSQYAFAGSLSTDGGTLTDTLSANYSDLDMTFNAGAESAAFGTMYLNGQFGSDTTPLDFTDPFAPATGSLASNLNAPILNPFDSHAILINEGQTFANFLSMTAVSAFRPVFQADLGSDSGLGWSLSFGGRTFSGTHVLGIEFSLDGSTYNALGSVNLSNVDTPFNLALGAAADGASELFFRFNFFGPGAGGGQPILDNVAISAQEIVPEPMTAGLLLAGLAGLAAARARRLRV